MWQRIKGWAVWAWAWVKAAVGHSRTIAVAYAVQAAGVLAELGVVDWPALLGAERGGRIASILSVVMIVLRLLTTGATSFKPKVPE